MAVLALDLGTTTGFALWTDGAITSGSWDMKPKRYEGSGMRYVRFTGMLNDMHAAVGITYIVFEEVRRHKGADAAHVYGGFMSHLQAWCEQRGVPLEAYPVGAIKKHWTGNGNASKDMMLDEAKRRGFAPEDDNEADALAMLDMAVGGGVL